MRSNAVLLESHRFERSWHPRALDVAWALWGAAGCGSTGRLARSLRPTILGSNGPRCDARSGRIAPRVRRSGCRSRHRYQGRRDRLGFPWESRELQDRSAVGGDAAHVRQSVVGSARYRMGPGCRLTVGPPERFRAAPDPVHPRLAEVGTDRGLAGRQVRPGLPGAYFEEDPADSLHFKTGVLLRSGIRSQGNR